MAHQTPVITEESPQVVRIVLDWPIKTGPPVEQTLPGTRVKNLRSRITKAIDQLLISYNTKYGATITVTIDPAQDDEFARPDPE